ncbi:MAG: hypothetical protein ACRENE_17760 [Polyangiaceae bacterium]
MIVLAAAALAVVALCGGCVASKCDQADLTCSGIPLPSQDAGQVTMDSATE